LSPEQTAEIAAATAEAWQRLVHALAYDELRSIALWRMEGFSVEEIASGSAMQSAPPSASSS
jgi:hypothetical protein